MYLHTASCISVQPVLVCPCVLTSLLPVVCCQVGLTGMPAKQATDPRKPARHVRTGKSCCSVTTEGLIKETHLRMRSSTLMASSSRFSLSCSAASLNRAAVSSSSSCSSAASSPCKWRYADVSLIVCWSPAELTLDACRSAYSSLANMQSHSCDVSIQTYLLQEQAHKCSIQEMLQAGRSTATASLWLSGTRVPIERVAEVCRWKFIAPLPQLLDPL